MIGVSRRTRAPFAVIATTLTVLTLSACADDGDGQADELSGSLETTVADPDIPSTTGNAPGPIDITLTKVAELSSPIAAAFHPTTGVPYVAERAGRVVFYPAGFDGSDGTDVALDLTTEVGELQGEQGLLGLSFSPDGTSLVVDHTEEARDGGTVIKMFSLADDGTVDSGSERILLRIDQPFSNHNGGNVAFGPDGYLYIGMGDGGSQGDPSGNGQNPSTLLGALLRIDPFGSSGDPYGIPDGNPYVDGSGRPEVFAIGLRNPWRFSFDRRTDDLWLADVGDSEIEEINRVPIEQVAGANFGWSLFEGTRRNADGEADSALTAPVFEYDHSVGTSITGGYVYRGDSLDGWQGSYLYSDFVAGGLERIDSTVPDYRSESIDFDEEPTSVVSFAEDSDGEIYVISLEGPVWTITPG